jgi:small-conductance mechanosensitive channel
MQPLASLWQNWGWAVLLVAGAIVLVVVGHWLVFRAAELVAGRTARVLDRSIVRHARGPVRLLVVLAAALVTLPALPLSPGVEAGVRHLVVLGLIGVVGWGLIELSWVGDDVVMARYPEDAENNLRARSVRTQVTVLRRVVAILVVVVAGAAMLMTFPGVQTLGASLLASAGIAGIALGLAVQPVLSNLVAGMQIAMTQPIRLDDVVVIDGEWGNVEEITSAYVVVRIWDQRRLVVPFSHIISQPFQNWTRWSADLLGTVFIYADYSVPVEEVREELHRILQASGMWDGKAWGLQVTNATERTLELRGLMSAPDSGTAWDLRCLVREQLASFLRERYPESLPRIRTELRPLSAPEGQP